MGHSTDMPRMLVAVPGFFFPHPPSININARLPQVFTGLDLVRSQSLATFTTPPIPNYSFIHFLIHHEVIHGCRSG